LESYAGRDDVYMAIQLGKGLPDAFRHQNAARAARMSKVVWKDVLADMWEKRRSGQTNDAGEPVTVEEIRKVGKQLTDLDDVLEQLESA
jgi:hypothetical protein